jgi:hypothetical protein
MSIFNNSIVGVTMSPAWALATGVLKDNNSSFGRSIGYVTAGTSNSVTAILASAYLPQASAAQRSFKSSSASDGPGGTGAQTIQLNYLDGNMLLQSEVVTLNGTTAVNTVSTTIRFVESIVVLSCGSNLANVGTISMFTATGGGGSTMGSIVIGDNATFWAQHYVPAGVTCYIYKHTGAGTASAGRTYMVAYGDPRTNNPIQQIGDIVIHLSGGTEDHDYDVPLVVTGPNYIVMRENPIATSLTNLAYASFDWIQD